MATTLYDPASGWKSYVLQARTNAAGAAVDDAGGEDLRTILDAFYTEGVVEALAFQVVQDSPVGMTVVIGSGSAKSDHAVIDGNVAGQGAYLVRMEDATVDLTVPAADLSNPRIDEVYLVIQDNAYDSTARVLPRIAYRDGTPATTPAAPGPDAAWDAFLLVATVAVGAGVTSIVDANITDGRVFVTSDVDVAAGRVQTASIDDLAVTAAKIADGNVNNAKITDLAVNNAKIADGAVNIVKLADGAVIEAKIGTAAVTTAKIADGAVTFPKLDGYTHGQTMATSTTSVTFTGTYQTLQSLVVSRPTGWTSYSIFMEAHATLRTSGSGPDFVVSVVARIDASDGVAYNDTLFTTGVTVPLVHTAAGLTAASTTVSIQGKWDFDPTPAPIWKVHSIIRVFLVRES